jgi:hypothetical protein
MRHQSLLLEFTSNLGPDRIMSFMKDIGLIPRSVICPSCGRATANTQRLRDSADGFVYKCVPCDKRITVRKGTIFENSSLPLSTLMILLWGFIVGMMKLYIYIIFPRYTCNCHLYDGRLFSTNGYRMVQRFP